VSKTLDYFSHSHLNHYLPPSATSTALDCLCRPCGVASATPTKRDLAERESKGERSSQEREGERSRGLLGWRAATPRPQGGLRGFGWLASHPSHGFHHAPPQNPPKTIMTASKLDFNASKSDSNASKFVFRFKTKT
jgi:hypothetical protein